LEVPEMSWIGMFGIVLLVVGTCALITLGVMQLGNLRNPDRVTKKQERRDARVLRKENAMPLWGHLMGWELAWKEWRMQLKYGLGKEYKPRHARADNEPPTEVLQAAYIKKYGRPIVTIGVVAPSMNEL
jgi:hypothetical protein